MMNPPEVFDLEDDEEVGCFYCLEARDFTTYRRGEAFLAGPDHPPFDGNANYICRRHLSRDAILPTGTEPTTEHQS